MWFDPAVVELVRDLTPVWLVVVLVALSFLGSATLITPVLVGLHWLERRRRSLTWIGIVFGSYALRSLIKSLNSLDRPPVGPPVDAAVFPALVRPLYEHPAEIATTSFPSGHVMTATVFWGLVAIDGRFLDLRRRIAIGATIVLIVGYSRVAVGAHYVGDVVGGILIALVYLGGMLILRRRASDPVGVTVGAAAVIAVAILSFSSSNTGEWVLGVCIGILLAWYWPTIRTVIDDPRDRTGGMVLQAASPVLLAVVGTAVVLVGEGSIRHVATLAAAGVMLVVVGRYPPVANRLAAIERRFGHRRRFGH